MDISHPEIPKGTYCYTSLKVINNPDDPNAKPTYKAEGVCPHWKKTENGARCELLNVEHHRKCGFHLVWDQVKECGINKENRNWNSTIRPGSVLKTITCKCGKEMEVWHWSRIEPFRDLMENHE
jgi:hypothetical protein